MVNFLSWIIILSMAISNSIFAIANSSFSDDGNGIRDGKAVTNNH